MSLFVDNTILSKVAKCTSAAVLGHVHHRVASEESAPAFSGQKAHEAMAHYFMGHPIEECLTIFEKGYKEWSDENVIDGDRLGWRNMQELLEIWMKQHPIDNLPYKVPSFEHVEVGFKQPLDEHGDYVLTGRMDLAVHDSAMQLCPLDHKFRGQITADWVRGFRLASQMTGYMWVCGKVYDKPVLKGYVNAIETRKLPENRNWKCKTHGTKYHECLFAHAKSQLIELVRTPDQLEYWRQNALLLAKRFEKMKAKYGGSVEAILNAPMEGSFDGGCAFCSFQTFCSEGKPISVINERLAYREWNPLDIVTGKVVES
jgi:PD-(D/E)XK nuclease superfamily